MKSQHVPPGGWHETLILAISRLSHSKRGARMSLNFSSDKDLKLTRRALRNRSGILATAGLLLTWKGYVHCYGPKKQQKCSSIWVAFCFIRNFWVRWLWGIAVYGKCFCLYTLDSRIRTHLAEKSNKTVAFRSQFSRESLAKSYKQLRFRIFASSYKTAEATKAKFSPKNC